VLGSRPAGADPAAGPGRVPVHSRRRQRGDGATRTALAAAADRRRPRRVAGLRPDADDAGRLRPGAAVAAGRQAAPDRRRTRVRRAGRRAGAGPPPGARGDPRRRLKDYPGRLWAEERVMKALTFQGTNKVSVETVADPIIQQPTDAIVRMTSTAICGSDLHLYDVLGMYIDSGDVLGHEPMGIVEEVGSEVTHIKPGDRVVVPFNISCGHC